MHGSLAVTIFAEPRELDALTPSELGSASPQKPSDTDTHQQSSMPPSIQAWNRFANHHKGHDGSKWSALQISF